uniref:Uncharacterized protein n=1 Tax=Gopherus evgoodei TaxID=1825980 RepID=A0A8C4YHQ9_9SAUR
MIFNYSRKAVREKGSGLLYPVCLSVPTYLCLSIPYVPPLSVCPADTLSVCLSHPYLCLSLSHTYPLCLSVCPHIPVSLYPIRTPSVCLSVPTYLCLSIPYIPPPSVCPTDTLSVSPSLHTSEVGIHPRKLMLQNVC